MDSQLNQIVFAYAEYLSKDYLTKSLGLPTLAEMDKQMAIDLASMVGLPTWANGKPRGINDTNPLTGTNSSRGSPSDQSPDFKISISGEHCTIPADGDLYYKIIDEITLMFLRVLEVDPKALERMVNDHRPVSITEDHGAKTAIESVLQKELKTNVKVMKITAMRSPEYTYTMVPLIRIHLSIALDQSFIDTYSDQDDTFNEVFSDLFEIAPPLAEDEIRIVNPITFETKIIKKKSSISKAQSLEDDFFNANPLKCWTL